MKIEAGKYYRRRRGDVVGPLTGVTWCDRTFMAADMTWHENGSYVLGLGHEYDLISEVYVSDTPPADAPAPGAKTLRDEFAMAALSGMLTDRDCGDVPATAVASAAYEYADSMMEARQCWKERRK
jgi:hypothetical protein